MQTAYKQCSKCGKLNVPWCYSYRMCDDCSRIAESKSKQLSNGKLCLIVILVLVTGFVLGRLAVREIKSATDYTYHAPPLPRAKVATSQPFHGFSVMPTVVHSETGWERE